MTPHDFDVQPIKLALCTVLAYVLDYVCYSCRLTDCDEHLIFYYLTVQEKYTCGKRVIFWSSTALCVFLLVESMFWLSLIFLLYHEFQIWSCILLYGHGLMACVLLNWRGSQTETASVYLVGCGASATAQMPLVHGASHEPVLLWSFGSKF